MKPGQPFDNTIFQNRMLYDYYDGESAYDQSPDSEKLTHTLKARVDLEKNTTIVGSFVSSETESDKSGEPGVFTLGQDKIKASYDGYGFKAVSQLSDKIRVSAYAKASETEVDESVITYEPMQTGGGAGITGGVTTPVVAHTEPAATRKSLNSGIDLVWRLARKSTLRLGYEYDLQDREWDEMETTIHTAKAKYNTRFGRDVKLRIGYTYDMIDEPFHNPTATLTPLTDNVLQAKSGIDGYIVGGTSLLYGTSFYGERTADLSNRPETAHEAKLNATWSPSAKFSTSLAIRFAMEENDKLASSWKQDTLVPTLSAWYAANNSLTLTAAYNYFDQRTKTAFCQGFYDG